MGRFSNWAAVAVAAALLVAGGGGYALASATQGTITVCVKHRGGGLYRASRCARHDAQLRWNLQGPAGPQGAQGAQGGQGIQGPKGDTGATGPITGVAPSGVTMTGMFDIEGYALSSGVLGEPINFPLSLSAPPMVVEVPWSQPNPDPAHCGGSPDAPTAAPGYLCVYDRGSANINAPPGCIWVCVQDIEANEPAANVFGARFLTRAASTGYARAQGTWAVTAP